MPNGLNNWSFKDVEKFLELHNFKRITVQGSHYYYQGKIDGKDRLADINFHRGKSIPIRTLEAIIHKSGIPKKNWRIMKKYKQDAS